MCVIDIFNRGSTRVLRDEFEDFLDYSSLVAFGPGRMPIPVSAFTMELLDFRSFVRRGKTRAEKFVADRIRRLDDILSVRLETPESAFVYALTSASVMHHVAKTCARGELKECGCAKAPLQRSTNQSHDGFEWGGCSDDLKFGRSISSTFLDAEENDRRRRKLVRLINWHNNEAGRQVHRSTG